MGRSLNINKTISLAQQQLTTAQTASTTTSAVVITDTNFVTSKGGDRPFTPSIEKFFPDSFPMLNNTLTLRASGFGAYDTQTKDGWQVQIASDSSFNNILTTVSTNDALDYGYEVAPLSTTFGTIDTSNYSNFYYRYRFVGNTFYYSDWSNVISVKRSPVIQSLDFLTFTANIKPIYFGTNFGDLTIDGTTYQFGEELPVGTLTSTTGYKVPFTTTAGDDILIIGGGINAVSNRTYAELVPGRYRRAKTVTKDIPAGDWEIYVVADSPIQYNYRYDGAQIATGSFTLSNTTTASIYMEWRNSAAEDYTPGRWEATINGTTYTANQRAGASGYVLGSTFPDGNDSTYGYGGKAGASLGGGGDERRWGIGGGSGFGGGARNTYVGTNTGYAAGGPGGGFGVFNGTSGLGSDPYNHLDYGCVLFRRVG